MFDSRHTRLAGTFLILLAVAACGENEDKTFPPILPEEPPPPTIVAFAAVPETIEAGGSSTLYWSTSHAASLQLLENGETPIPLGEFADTGSVEVRPSATTSYLLVAHGSDPEQGQARRTLTVTVEEPRVPPPTIVAFAASPAVVAMGGEAVLTWKTTDATRITLTDDTGENLLPENAPADEGQYTVAPTRSPTTYHLVAAGPGGRVGDTVSVEVSGHPRISKFFVEPIAPVREGGTITLVWETTNATRVRIRDGATDVLDTALENGRHDVVIQDNTTFILEATGPAGTSEATALARVGPGILDFAAEPRTVRAGDTIELRWRTEDADRAVIDGPGGFHLNVPVDQVADGRATVEVATRGEFVLSAFRQDVAVPARLAIEVTESPRIRELTVTPEEVTAALDRPATVILSWRQDGADSCTIFVNNSVPDGMGNFPCGTTGSQEIAVRGNTNLRLVAANAAGQHARTVLVAAIPPARVETFARHPARRVAPGEEVELSWSVTDAVDVSLTHNGAPIAIDSTAPTGAVTVPVDGDPAVETTHLFALTARNSRLDPTVEELAVIVGKPVILEARAVPSFVGIGDAFDLEWTADGGDLLTIAGPDGEEVFRTNDPAEIDLGSATLLAPLQAGTYTYTLVSENAAGESLPFTVEMVASDGPMIESFTVDPAAISLGQSATFSWIVRNDPDNQRPTLTLADFGNTYPAIAGKNPNQDSLTITPTVQGIYTFTLTATTPGRTPATARVVLDVSVPPEILAFTASHERVSTEGGTVVPDVELSWQTRETVELTLWVRGDDGNLVPPPFHRVSLAQEDPQAVIDQGSWTVHPTVSTTYVARARNRVGTDVFADVRVIVDPPEVLSFTVTPSEISEGETVTLSWTTLNADEVRIEPMSAFIDIAGKPGAAESSLTSDEDVETIQFPAGFTFPFEGTPQTQIQVSSNGWAGFNTSNSSTAYTPSQFPTSSYSYVNFALFWCDLTSSPGGKVWYGMASDVLGDFFVVQWKNWHWLSYSSTLNFELILRPNGNFEYRYGPMTADDAGRAAGAGCEIGYQGTSTTQPWALFVPYQQAHPGGLTNVTFFAPTPPSFPTSGSITVAPSESTVYTLTALNPDASDSAQARVTVWKEPAFSTVRTDPAPPMANQPFDIRWTAHWATRMRVYDAAGVQLCDVIDPAAVLSGSCPVTAPGSGVATYRLVAENGPLGMPVASASYDLVTVVLPYLGVTRFEATPMFPAAAGETVTIHWATSGAIEMQLRACAAGTANCVDITPPGANPVSGSTTYVIPGSTEFVLTVGDMLGRVAEAVTGAYLNPARLEDVQASAHQIAAGESVTLTWDTTNATEVSIGGVPLVEEVTATAPYVTLAGNGGATLTLAGGTDGGRYVFNFPAGFTFPYFGTNTTGLVASVDGWVTFHLSDTSYNSGGQTFPTSSTYSEVQMGLLWMDLEVVSPAQMLWAQGTTPQGVDYVVVEWKNWEDYFDSSSDFNFQLVLYEDGVFEFRYGSMVGSWSDGTIGFQSFDRSRGYTLTPASLSNRSWRFRQGFPLDGSLTLTPTDSTTYRVCATNASAYQACDEVRVVVVAPGDLLFSEAMIAPASPDAEWFELRNLSPDPIDLSVGAWSITAGAGETFVLPDTAPTIPPNGYLVFARSGVAADNGGLVPDLVYGSALTLDDATDTLELLLGGLSIDRFTWDSAWTIPAGRSIAAEPSWLAPNPVVNDLPTAWCPSTASYGNGTFTGSPGSAGAGCLAPAP
jgi:hypothetical protein